jgi:hypothetical protein
MATNGTTSGLLCSRLLRALCALAVLCLLVVAVPAPTRPDYDSAYHHYSKQEISRAITWHAKNTRSCLLRCHGRPTDFSPACGVSQGRDGLMQLTPAPRPLDERPHTPCSIRGASSCGIHEPLPGDRLPWHPRTLGSIGLKRKSAHSKRACIGFPLTRSLLPK